MTFEEIKTYQVRWKRGLRPGEPASNGLEEYSAHLGICDGPAVSELLLSLRLGGERARLRFRVGESY